jgi:hypothetical protein
MKRPSSVRGIPPGERAVSKIGPTLEGKLLAYAVAASAAGVGVLAMAQPSLAKVIYTPGNVPVVEGGPLLALDLNHDGIAEFSFRNNFYSSMGLGAASLAVIPTQAANEIFGVQSQGKQCAVALPKGSKVGPKGKFGPTPSGAIMAYVDIGRAYAYCPWFNVETAYVGLKFVVKGETHYGWARVKFVEPGSIPGGFNSATLSGYAYETVPNRPVITGQRTGTEKVTVAGDASPSPAGLGMLAKGAPGVELWRRLHQIGSTR